MDFNADKKVLTVKEAAAIMRISSSAMYKLVREERVPYIAVGKRRVIPAASFLIWLVKATVGGVR